MKYLLEKLIGLEKVMHWMIPNDRGMGSLIAAGGRVN